MLTIHTQHTGYKITVEGPRIKLHVHADSNLSAGSNGINLKLVNYQDSGSASGSTGMSTNNTKYQVCFASDASGYVSGSDYMGRQGHSNYYWITFHVDKSSSGSYTLGDMQTEPTMKINGSSVEYNESTHYNCGSGWSYETYNTGSVSDSTCEVYAKVIAKPVITDFVVIKDGQAVSTLSTSDYYREMTSHPSYPTYTGYTCQGVYDGKTTSSSKVYNTTERIVSNGRTYYVIYTKNNYYVDVNNYLDGVENGPVGKGFSFNVKINNGSAGADVTDYYTQQPYDTIVEVTDIKINAGYSYDRYTVSVSGAEQSGSSKSNIKIKVPAQAVTINLYFVTNSYTLTVNPNGGTWNDSSSSQNFTQKYNTTKSIPNPDAREGYTFTGWSRSGSGSLSGTTFTFGAGDCTLTAQWSINSYSLSVDPNGGTWNGSSSVSSVSQNYATTKSLTAPSRTGYSLGAWVLDGGGSISTFGKLHSKSADPFFMDGTNSTVVYNNSSNGTVTHQYLASSNAGIELPTGARILRIKNAGTSSPGLGGFSNHLPTEPNHIFYTIIYAKIPKGYSIQFGTNSLGTNGSSAWLTDKAGTGDWKIYICKIQCGTDKGSTTNFYYINGGANGTASNPVVWDVAYFGTYDATGLSASGSSSSTPTFTYPASNSSIVALWNLGTFTVTVNPNGGTYNGKTGSQSVSGLYTQTSTIAAPTRYGYNFAGWAISGGNGTLSTFGKVCSASTDPLFTTSKNNVGMYNNSNDKSVTHTLISASSAGLSNWISGGRVLRVSYTGSCTWGNGLVQSISTSANKVFYTMIYAKVPVGYTLEPAYNASGTGATRTWITSNQGTGNWQTYVMRWNCGSSGTFSNIGYWYIQGNAGSASKPVNLDIAYLCSFDATGLSSTTGVATSPFVYTYGTSDVTLFALWEETWLNHTTPFSGSGTEADPYIIASAENLAYLSKQVYDGASNYAGKYFKQTKNIDLTKYNWQPIGIEQDRNNANAYHYFGGSYDGNGYTISGLHTPKGSSSAYSYQGLFGIMYTSVSSTLKNITLENVDVRGNNRLGGIVGWWISGNGTFKMQNCSVSGNISGVDYVGGLVGCSETRSSGTIEISASIVSATVVGGGSVGGITGYTQKSGSGITIKNNIVLSTTTVEGKNGNIGGLVGTLANATLTNNYTMATVTGAGIAIGGFVGTISNSVLTNNGFEGNMISTVSSAGAGIGNASGTNQIENNYAYGKSGKNAFIGSGSVNGAYIYVLNVNGTTYKRYHGSVSGFVWVSGSPCPIPKDFSWVGGNMSSVTTSSLTSNGFSSI